MSEDIGFDVPQLGREPAERLASAVVPASLVTWTAAEILHWAAVPGAVDAGLAAAGAALLAWVAAAYGKVPGAVPAWTAVSGGWLAAAWSLGPLHWWPAPALSIIWAAGTWKAARDARRHEAVTSAREWREAREDWLVRCRAWGLGGSHLLAFERTRLGELYTVSTKGTRRKRSQILASGLAETIAEAEDLDENRVQLVKHGPAGRIRIEVRRADPWAGVLLHPLAVDDHEIRVPERRSILTPAVVGQDPATGEPLTIPLCDENGAKRVSITANSGGGKGVLEDNLLEHVTACDDALAVHLNLSVKGREDEEVWGPACWLTAYGPDQKARAAAVLKVISDVIEWRTVNFRRGRYAPSPEHPAIIIFNDESDSALGALREDINTIVTKGRSHGVGWARLGQRNTREYTDPKARSQDNVRCTGLVQNSNEARHAGSGAGPDMSTYGEGKPGAWKVELLGGPMSLGRTWMFGRTEAAHVAFAEDLARERAFTQPDISGECREYLGSRYEALRATEVFERWARREHGDEFPPPGGSEEPPAPAPAAAPGEPGAGTAPAAGAVRTAVAEEDPFDRWLEMNVDEDPDTAVRLASVREKLGAARQALEQAAAPQQAPAVPLEAREAQAAEAWRKVGEQASIPAGVLPRLLEMLAEGTTIRAVAEAFPGETGGKRWPARQWLEKLRGEGAAVVDGDRSNARWRLAAPPPPGDEQ
jgi:hypothetical protein